MQPHDTADPRWYVYMLVRPDGRVIYVGKGTNNRVLAHEAEAAKGCTCYKCRAIRKVWRTGGEIERTIVFRTDDEDAAFDYEKHLIAEIGLENLTNIAEGGRVPASVQAALDQKTYLASKSDGSIYRRKNDGRLVGSLTISTDPNGKIHRRVVYGKSIGEVEAKLDQLRDERERQRILAKVTDTAMSLLRRQVEVFGNLDSTTAYELIEVVEYCRSQYRSMMDELEALKKERGR